MSGGGDGRLPLATARGAAADRGRLQGSEQAAPPEGADSAPVRALLIGIDHYEPPPRKGIPHYGHLAGAVRDVERMERWLRRSLGVPAGRIERLVAPRGEHRPAALEAELPTYERMVAALRRLASEARPGEQVWIYYAGHGGQAPTIVPERKGPHGIDESLVPWNVGDPGARYLRDVELAVLVAEIERAGAFATVVLDCCHSGGALRKGQLARGVDQVDFTPRPASAVLAAVDPRPGPLPEIRRAETSQRPTLTWRHADLAGSRDLDPTGYVLLAACRPGERAVEEPGDDGDQGGAFTRSLLRVLGGRGETVTYERLFEHVRCDVRSRFPHQTPMIEGERDRELLGGRALPADVGVAVIGGEGGDGASLRLATGAVHGIVPGARFAVRRSQTAAADGGAGGVEGEPAAVEVRWVGASVSEALMAGAGEPPQPGDRVELVDRGPAAARLRVPVGVEEGAPSWAGDAVERLRRRLQSADSQWARPWSAGAAADESAGADAVASADGSRAPFEVRLGAAGFFELRDADGRELPHTGPALAAADPAAAALAARRLDHLARWETLRRLENLDPRSALHGGLLLALTRLPPGWEPGRPVRGGEPIARRGGVAEVETGTWIALRIVNLSPDELDVAVLDLRPDWSVVQVFPAWRGGCFQPIDADGFYAVPLRTSLPEGMDEGTDTLLVLATTGPVSHRWLEMPALADEGAVGGLRSAVERSTAEAPGHLATDTPPASQPRGAAVQMASAGRARRIDDGADGWVTAKVKLRVVRR